MKTRRRGIDYRLNPFSVWATQALVSVACVALALLIGLAARGASL